MNPGPAQPSPVARGPDELDELIPHLAFEFAALERASQDFESTGYWVFLEGFLLHARLLRDFLWGTPQPRFSDTEVLGEHYLAIWPSVRPPLPKTLAVTRRAINAQLTHLSRARVRPKKARDLAADADRLRDELRVGIDAFIEALGPDPRAGSLSLAVTEKCRLLGVPSPLRRAT